MIVFNPLSDHFLFVFGNMKLFGPTISTPGQDKAGVFVSFLTSTIKDKGKSQAFFANANLLP
jgi:hypothetical protein